MTEIDYESALFDVLETLKGHYPQIAGGFARGTGGFDRDYILGELRKRASAPAGDGVESAFRQALEDVCNPLAYLQRKAEADGARLGGMAYTIANDLATVQGIARDALSAALARPRAAVGEREA